MPLYTFTIAEFCETPDTSIFTSELKAKRYAILWALAELESRHADEEYQALEDAANDEGVDAAYDFFIESGEIAEALEGINWNLQKHEGIGA